MRFPRAVVACAALFLFGSAAQAQGGVPGQGGSPPAPDGEPVRITSAPAFESYPAWSPDGRRIAYTRYEKGVQKIFVVEVEEDDSGELKVGRPRQVTRGGGIDARPAWLVGAEGDELVFCSNRSGYWQLYRVNVDSALASDDVSSTQLKQPITGWNPAWSGQAFRLAYARGHDIFTAGLDGRDERQLLVATGHNDWPAWSPDGKKLVYTGDEDLWVADPSTTGGPAKVLPLTNRAWNAHAAWTARGDRIAFVSTRGKSYDIWMVSASVADEPVRLTSDPAREEFPSWRPDGLWLCYASNRGARGDGRGGYDIWAIKVSFAGAVSTDEAAAPVGRH